MAARKQKYMPEAVREKIRVSQLVNRLQDNALASEEFMTAGQIKSAEALLDRVLPKMKTIEHSGELTTNIVRRTIYEAKPD